MREFSDDEGFEFYRSFLEFYCRWFKPASYLEVGLHSGQTFRRLIPYCDRLIGIDSAEIDWGEFRADAKCEVHRATSDEYFRDHPDQTYDLVFIDGNHEAGQVLRDVRNAVARLRPNGLVAAHDTFPPSPDLVNPRACGDAYRAAIELRQDRSLEVYTVPVRFGLTLIGKIGTTFPWAPLG